MMAYIYAIAALSVMFWIGYFIGRRDGWRALKIHAADGRLATRIAKAAADHYGS